MHTAASVVGGLPVHIPGALTQLLLFAVVLLTAFGNKRNHTVFVYFGKMTHENVTVSLVVEVAVITLTLELPTVEVEDVTPAEKVAVSADE